MSLNKSLIIILLFLTIIQCNRERKSIPTIEIYTDTVLYSYSDSSYFNDIRSITCCANKYYLADYKRDQIIVLDSNLKIVNIIGEKGEGPGEFLGLSHIYIYLDTIYAYNDGKRIIEKYFDNKYLNSINIPVGIPIKAHYKFLITDSSIIYGYANDSFGICSFDLNDNSIEFFGSLKKRNSVKETQIKNCRHILGYKNEIISISDYKPIIEIYDNMKNLKIKCDYSYVNATKKRIDFIHNFKEEQNSFYNIISDVTIYENHLFILVYSCEEDKVTCNKIIEFLISKDSCFPIKTYNLGNGFYGSICILKNHIVAFDRKNGVLVRYKI